MGKLLLAVIAVGVAAATVAVVDEAGGGHPEGLKNEECESVTIECPKKNFSSSSGHESRASDSFRPVIPQGL